MREETAVNGWDFRFSHEKPQTTAIICEIRINRFEFHILIIFQEGYI